MSSVSDTITSINNNTAHVKSSSTAKKEVTGEDFLLLMTQQLQNQDPMDPASTSDLLAQEAQFTSLSKTEEMAKNIASNNGIMLALLILRAPGSIMVPYATRGCSSGV